MRDFNHSMKLLCDRNRDGARGTQSNRLQQLNQIGNELKELGYPHVKSMDDVKSKHAWALVKHWQGKNLSTGSIKNRMVQLRWAAEKTNNSSKFNSSNAHYGIDDRVFSSGEDKSLNFTAEQINKIQDQHVQVSTVLQREFGLRREEAMKLIPTKADKGDHLFLQASWCKGRRERTVPITTGPQREALRLAHDLVGKGSLIPTDRTYVQHMRRFEKETSAVGLGQTHGARHAYAQKRYVDITGRPCPVKGGKTSKELKRGEKITDRRARLIISKELGHVREAITVNYLGR